MKTSGFLKTILNSAGIDVPDETAEKFIILKNEMILENKFKNITAINDFKNIFVRHFLDSLMILRTKQISQCKTLLDVGSGAGFPGLPIAMIHPEKNMLLIESNTHKCDYLRNTSSKLNLRNIDIANIRAEKAASQTNYIEKFNGILIRAFSEFKIAIEISINMVKKGGYIFYYASEKQKNSIINIKRTFKIFRCRIEDIFNYELPYNSGKYAIIIVKKLWKTPHKFPRAYNKIRKNPI